MLTIATLVLFCFATLSQAQLVQERSTVDNSGQVVSGGTLSGVTAGGQPGGIITSSGGDLTLYAGFLGCVTLQPTLDTDGDGVVDEMDADNDNDNLSDIAELHGSSFTPTTVTDLNSTDTDNDGAPDGDESLSMTNPQDGTAYLHVTRTDFNPFVPNKVSIEWFARGGSTYNVYFRKNSDLLPGTLLDTVLVTGGAAPWFETTATIHTGISSWPDMTYHIEKVP